VVDLVREPGSVHKPDSSINGGLLSPVPSPFQISLVKEFRRPSVRNESCSQVPISKRTCAASGPLTSGMVSLKLSR